MNYRHNLDILQVWFQKTPVRKISISESHKFFAFPGHIKILFTLLVTQSHLTLHNPMDYIACQAPVSMEFSRQEYWSR